jgi:hAT family C-terminal dimerisation region
MGYNKNSCSELISQLRIYKLKEAPYNLSYLEGSDTPLKWWNTCFSTQNQLQQLAIQLFSITPHAASCERIWSSIGWIYGKRRTQLSVQTVESLTKIYRFYMSNVKKELRNYQTSISENEIIELVNKSLSDTYEEPTEENEAIILSNLNKIEPIERFDNNEILEIDSIFNLEPIVMIEYMDVSQFEYQNIELDEENNSDYDVEDLISNLVN